MYRHPRLLTNALPTQADLKSALQQADAESDTSRDVRPLMAILTRLVSANSRLRGHILTRRTAITAFSWRIIANDTKDEERAREAGLRLRHVIGEIMQNHMQSRLFDALCIELEWNVAGNSGRAPRIVRRYAPVELEKRDDYSVNLLENTSALKRGQLVDVQHLPTTFLLDISDDDERGGIMRTLAPHELLRHDMMKEWANYNRKLKGIVHLMWDEGAEKDERAAGMEALQSVVKNNYLATSKAIDFNVHEVVKGSATSFRELIDKIQSDTAIAILGQANTSEIAPGSGSRAALQVLKLISADIHYDDVIRVEGIVNNQLIAHDWNENYDKTGTSAAPWRFEINIPEEEDRAARVMAVVDFYNAGIPMRADDVYSTTGFTRPDKVDDLLVKKEPLA